MSTDAGLVLQALFFLIWQLFTAWHIPGTRVTPGAFLIFLLFAGMCIRFVTSILGMGGAIGADISRHSRPPRGSGGSKPGRGSK